MNCPKCGTTNEIGYKFCTKCGQSLESVQSSTVQTFQQNETSFQSNSAPKQYTNVNSESSVKVTFLGYFFIILAVILKPFTAFKEELNKFNDFKNSAIMSVIVSGAGTLINLIKTMFSSVMVKTYDWSSASYKTAWTWGNLKEINYLEVIGKNFLIYLGIIAVVAAVYYIAGLIVKKQTNFSRLLGISAISIVPMLICSLVLSPLLSSIWAELAMPITIIGLIYTIVLIYEGMNNEILLEGNMKYYFNLVCLSILGIAAYYLYMKVFISSVSGGLEDIMDLFG